jgi:hypothetical protein
MKQLTNFEAIAPPEFREKMIAFWMDEEEISREKALKAYDDKDFKNLCKAVIGKVREYKPDLGYEHREFCFYEKIDNVIIPVDILEVVD